MTKILAIGIFDSDAQHGRIYGAAGAVGQALLALGRLDGLELWGAARGEHAAMIRELGGGPIDYQREDLTGALPGGFDVVFDGIGEDGYCRSSAALKPTAGCSSLAATRPACRRSNACAQILLSPDHFFEKLAEIFPDNRRPHPAKRAGCGCRNPRRE